MTDANSRSRSPSGRRDDRTSAGCTAHHDSAVSLRHKIVARRLFVTVVVAVFAALAAPSPCWPLCRG